MEDGKFNSFEIGEVAKAAAMECVLYQMSQHPITDALVENATATPAINDDGMLSTHEDGSLRLNDDGLSASAILSADGDPSNLSDKEAAILYGRIGIMATVVPEMFPKLDLMTEDRQIKEIDENLVNKIAEHYDIGEYDALGLAAFHGQDEYDVMNYIMTTDPEQVKQNMIETERAHIITELTFSGEQFDDARVEEELQKAMPLIEQQFAMMNSIMSPITEEINQHCEPAKRTLVDEQTQPAENDLYAGSWAPLGAKI